MGDYQWIQFLNLKMRKNLKKVDKQSYKLFNDIFSYYCDFGTFKIIPSIKPIILKYFGKRDSNGKLISSEKVFESVRKQRIINIFNEWTGQGTLYNSLKI